MGIGFSFGDSDKKEKSTTDRTQTMSGTSSSGMTGQTFGSGSSQASFWTPQQQQLASKLSGYLSNSWGKAPSQEQQTGINALTQVATGQYSDDPMNSYYQALKKETLENLLPEATNTIAKQANLYGMLNSGAGLEQQLNKRNEIVNSLASTLANMQLQTQQGREGRQTSAAQALIASDPRQQQIANIMSMLGIRGTTSETSQQAGQTSQQSIENLARTLTDYIKQKGSGSADNTGLSFGF